MLVPNHRTQIVTCVCVYLPRLRASRAVTPHSLLVYQQLRALGCYQTSAPQPWTEPAPSPLILPPPGETSSQVGLSSRPGGHHYGPSP